MSATLPANRSILGCVGCVAAEYPYGGDGRGVGSIGMMSLGEGTGGPGSVASGVEVGADVRSGASVVETGAGVVEIEGSGERVGTVELGACDGGADDDWTGGVERSGDPADPQAEPRTSATPITLRN